MNDRESSTLLERRFPDCLRVERLLVECTVLIDSVDLPFCAFDHFDFERR